MKRKRFFIFIYLLLILFAQTNFGQILPLHNYTIKDGLTSDNIESICQDSLGYIWIGTGEGISVFDSREFRNYSTVDGLSSNKINYILADRRNPGIVWVGTNGAGIDRYNYGKFENFGRNVPDKMKFIITLFEDENNVLWCGTDSGFYFIQNDSIHHVSTSFHIGSVNSFTERKPNEILLGTEHGLFRYLIKEKKLEKINLLASSSPTIITMLHSKNGLVFAATVDGQLFRINNSEISSIILNESPRTMIEDGYNNLWIGTIRGLLKINEQQFSTEKIVKYNSDNGLLENNIPSLLYDRENILWIGTNDNGLSKLTYQNLARFQIPKKYITANWASVVSDNNNHFWAALNKYILEIWKDKNDFWHEHFHQNNNYEFSGALQYLYCSTNNKLYIVAPAGVILVYNIKLNHASLFPSNLELKEKIQISRNLKYAGLFKMIEDKDGYLWCSALDIGVIVINKSKPRNIVKIYTRSEGLPDNSVRELFQDSNGNIWFGGYDGGLAVFSYGKILHDVQKLKSNEKIFTRLFTTSSGLPDNGIRSIDENQKGNMVVGTRYGGLAIYKNGKFKTISRKDGLLSDAVWSMTKTLNENIWIGTQSGVQELTEDGLPSFKLYEELPKVPYYSICSSNTGDLCFASQSDVYIYEPNKAVEKNLPPPIYINHLLINGQEQKIKSDLSLPNYQNTITIDFIGIINREERNTVYEYRLLNIDKKWNELKNRNSVTYASLRPGLYTFQVFAVNGKNIKSKIPAEISFAIETPFYLRWWFISAILFIIIISIALYSRMRFNRLIEIEKIRTRIAADLHDEIGSGLTRIAILSENALREESFKKNLGEQAVIKDDNEKYSRYGSIERVGKISRDLVDSMIDVIWSIDPKYDSLQDFIFNFQNYANEVCEAKNIQLIIETNNIENVKVNSQIKRSLQLITKESLNNALKYSRCKTFKLNLYVKNKSIYLILEDDGTGFDIEKIKHGRGLFNITKHVNELKGNFKIDSKDGGTKLIIDFPIQS